MNGLLKFNNKIIEKSISKFENKFEYLNDCKSHLDMIELKCIEHDIIFKVSVKNHLRSDSGSCPLCKTINMKNLKSVEE